MTCPSIPAMLLLLTGALALLGGCPRAKNKGQSTEAGPRKIDGPVDAVLAARLPLVSGDKVLPDAPLVTVSMSSVTVNGSQTNTLRNGVFADSAKRDGQAGFFVDVLFGQLGRVAKALAKTGHRRCFLLAAAESVPYHTVAAVLYTASQAKFQCYQIAVIKPPESRATLTAINMSFSATAKPRGKGPLGRLDVVPHRDPWGREFYASRHFLTGAGRASTERIGPFGTLDPMTGRGAAVSSDTEDALGALMGHTAGDESGLGGEGRGGAGGTGFGGWGGFGTSGGSDAAGLGNQGFGVGKHKETTPKVFMSRASVSGGLDAATIRRVVRRHLAEIKYCYMSIGLPAKPDLSGMVKVSWTILPTGAVGQISIAVSTLSHPGTERCIKAAVKRWRFPKPEGSMPFITYPFHFKPKG